MFSRYCSVYNRFLHSFPTRRSSDLSSCADHPMRRASGLDCRAALTNRCQQDKIRVKRAVSSGTPNARRSEEHTSELQSPDHLVCRLLLEKKRKIKIT